MWYWIVAITVFGLIGYAISKISDRSSEKYVPVRVKINRNR